MATLFEASSRQRRQAAAPLADRIRPANLDEVVGHAKLLAPGAAFRRMVEGGQLVSMLFWGPPGSGKTTLARLVADRAHYAFVHLSAVTSGLADLRRTVAEAEQRFEIHGQRTAVFVDEIHRFTKSQQDALLPHVEDGTIVFIAATTENPSFEVNAALLSRCKVFVLEKASLEDVRIVLHRALQDRERGLGALPIDLAPDVEEALVGLADGDHRASLNALELLVKATPKDVKTGRIVLKKEDLAALLQRSTLLYDKNGEEHYNLISALHKSLRGSDADASLYWLARMLEAGEDPLYVARRLVRFASEDIGLADPQALVQAVAAYQACHYLGMPECTVHLAQIAAYMAKAPKSNALYVGYSAARADAAEGLYEPVPLHLRNAPTGLMKDLGYGKGYRYNPDFDGPVEQDYLPEKLKGKGYLP